MTPGVAGRIWKRAGIRMFMLRVKYSSASSVSNTFVSGPAHGAGHHGRTIRKATDECIGRRSDVEGREDSWPGQLRNGQEHVPGHRHRRRLPGAPL